MKSKVAISLDSRVLNIIDKMNGNRSNVIEKLIVKSLGIKDLTTCLILAGGEGIRLRPITYEIPKPLIPIKNKPILKWQIEFLKKNGIEDIFVSVGYKANQIIRKIGNVSYIKEDEPMGTGGGVKLFEEKCYFEGSFLTMNCDVVFSPFPKIQDIFDFHNAQKCVATLLLVSAENVQQGVAKLKGNKIIEFTEKPEDVKYGLISAGVYIFNPQIFDYVEYGSSLETDVFPTLAREGLLAGYVYDGKIWDIGTTKGYEAAIHEWSPRKVVVPSSSPLID